MLHGITYHFITEKSLTKGGNGTKAFPIAVVDKAEHRRQTGTNSPQLIPANSKPSTPCSTPTRTTNFILPKSAGSITPIKQSPSTHNVKSTIISPLQDVLAQPASKKHILDNDSIIIKEQGKGQPPKKKIAVSPANSSKPVPKPASSQNYRSPDGRNLDATEASSSSKPPSPHKASPSIKLKLGPQGLPNSSPKTSPPSKNPPITPVTKIPDFGSPKNMVDTAH